MDFNYPWKSWSPGFESSSCVLYYAAELVHQHAKFEKCNFRPKGRPDSRDAGDCLAPFLYHFNHLSQSLSSRQIVMFSCGATRKLIHPAAVLLFSTLCSTAQYCCASSIVLHVMLCWQISFATWCNCACLGEVRERSLTSPMSVTSGP